jgi:hypothetical protein
MEVRIYISYLLHKFYIQSILEIDLIYEYINFNFEIILLKTIIKWIFNTNNEKYVFIVFIQMIYVLWNFINFII